MLEIGGCVKQYGSTTAVDDFFLEIAEGEFVSILGPSGSGKTTTLRLVAGFEQPDSGRIVLDGEDITSFPPEERDMGMVFQRLALFPHMSVSDNISYGLRMATDLPESEIEDRMKDALEMVDLAGYEDRNINNLSGGEQQRVALSRAIVTEPRVLLFDEPLSDLDRKLRESMRREIRDLHDKLDVTSLYVTHDQREALTLSDRIAIMHEGELVQVDPPADVYNDPRNRFVADFIGDSNFVRGEVRDENGQARFVGSGISLPTSGKADGGNGVSEFPGDELTLYIRPEDLTLGAGDGQNSFACTVESAVHLGSTTEYQVRVDEDIELLVRSLGPPRFDDGEQPTVTVEKYDFLPAEI